MAILSNLRKNRDISNIQNKNVVKKVFLN